VSEGQGQTGIEKVLRAIGERNACTAPGTARRRLWRLLRELKAIEKASDGEIKITDFLPAFDEWYLRSRPHLEKTRDAYLAEFVGGLGKVKYATNEGDILNEALQSVSKLPDCYLPIMPAMPDAPMSWRKLAALHRELCRRSGGKTHFLSYRDAAKVYEGLSHQEAHTITGALVQLGVIKIVRKGKAGLKSGKAAEFQYLLPDTEITEEIPV
jgi:hypothetical protein